MCGSSGTLEREQNTAHWFSESEHDRNTFTIQAKYQCRHEHVHCIRCCYSVKKLL
jgi:hypothetical protein